MRVKKIFEIQYEAPYGSSKKDSEDWLNVFNLKMILDKYAEGGKPYEIAELEID